MLKQNWNNLEIGNGLTVAEEIDGGVRVGDGSEELEDAAKAADPEEGELGTGVPESGPECKRDFSVHSLLIKRLHQISDCRR